MLRRFACALIAFVTASLLSLFSPVSASAVIQGQQASADSAYALTMGGGQAILYPVQPAGSLCAPGKLRRDRHGSCALTSVSYDVVQSSTGDVIGTGVIAFGYSETLSASSWEWALQATIELTKATGVVAVGTAATVAAACTHCTASGAWQRALAVGVRYTHSFAVTGQGGTFTTTGQAPVIAVTNPFATKAARSVRLPGLGPARCDKVAVAGTQGCVFSDVPAVYYVYLNGHNENEVARNIQIAQQSKPHHFGWYAHGTALTRAVNVTVQNKNNHAACGKMHYNKPWSCVEYPFAATFQGASYDPADDRIARVPSTQASAEAGYLLTMYRTERLMNTDRYWVFVVP